MAPRKPKESSTPRNTKTKTAEMDDEFMADDISEVMTPIVTPKKTTAKKSRKVANAGKSSPTKVSSDKVVKIAPKTPRSRNRPLKVARSLMPAFTSITNEISPLDKEEQAEDDEADHQSQMVLQPEAREFDLESEMLAADPESTNLVNGRRKGRNLVQWKRPRMAEKLLLCLQYECQRASMTLPWDKAVHRLSPGATGTSALQNLNKLRDILITEGHEVPPVLGKAGYHETNPHIRGYARKPGSTNVHQAVARFWTDPVVHLKESLQDHGIIRGSGQYRKIQSHNTFREQLVQDLENKGESIPDELKTPIKYTTIAQHKAQNGGIRTVYEGVSATSDKPATQGSRAQGSRARKGLVGNKKTGSRKAQRQIIKSKSHSETEMDEGVESNTSPQATLAKHRSRRQRKPVNYTIDIEMEAAGQSSSDDALAFVSTPSKPYTGGGKEVYHTARKSVVGNGVAAVPPKTSQKLSTDSGEEDSDDEQDRDDNHPSASQHYQPKPAASFVAASAPDSSNTQWADHSTIPQQVGDGYKYEDSYGDARLEYENVDGKEHAHMQMQSQDASFLNAANRWWEDKSEGDMVNPRTGGTTIPNSLPMTMTFPADVNRVPTTSERQQAFTSQVGDTAAQNIDTHSAAIAARNAAALHHQVQQQLDQRRRAAVAGLTSPSITNSRNDNSSGGDNYYANSRFLSATSTNMSTSTSLTVRHQTDSVAGYAAAQNQHYPDTNVPDFTDEEIQRFHQEITKPGAFIHTPEDYTSNQAYASMRQDPIGSSAFGYNHNIASNGYHVGGNYGGFTNATTSNGYFIDQNNASLNEMLAGDISQDQAFADMNSYGPSRNGGY